MRYVIPATSYVLQQEMWAYCSLIRFPLHITVSGQ